MNPYRWTQPEPDGDEDPAPKSRIPWGMIVHALAALIACYGTAYLHAKAFALWAFELNVSVCALLVAGLIFHACFRWVVQS